MAKRKVSCRECSRPIKATDKLYHDRYNIHDVCMKRSRNFEYWLETHDAVVGQQWADAVVGQLETHDGGGADAVVGQRGSFRACIRAIGAHALGAQSKNYTFYNII